MLRTSGLERSATADGDALRCVTYRRCLNSQIMSPAVGMPAAADAPAPRNHINLGPRSENRRAKSSGSIVGSSEAASVTRCSSVRERRKLNSRFGLVMYHKGRYDT